MTQQPSELSPAPASAAPVLPLLLQRLPHAQHIPQGAGLAPLTAAPEAQEEEQLLFPFFFPQALTPPCPGLLGAVPKPCALQSTLPTARPDPKTAKAAGLSVAGDLLTLSESVFFTTERRGIKRHSSACLEATAAIQKAETSALIKKPLSALLTLVKASLPTAAIWIPQKAKLHLTARITPATFLGLVTPC